jgi:hypothetical protein
MTVVLEDAPRVESATREVTGVPLAPVIELIRALYDDLSATVGGLKLTSQAVSSDPRLLELIALTRARVAGAAQHLEAFEQLAVLLQADPPRAAMVPLPVESQAIRRRGPARR